MYVSLHHLIKMHSRISGCWKALWDTQECVGLFQSLTHGEEAPRHKLSVRNTLDLTETLMMSRTWNFFFPGCWNEKVRFGLSICQRAGSWPRNEAVFVLGRGGQSWPYQLTVTFDRLCNVIPLDSEKSCLTLKCNEAFVQSTLVSWFCCRKSNFAQLIMSLMCCKPVQSRHK